MSSLNRSIYTERLMRVAPQIRAAGVSGDYFEPTVAELCAGYDPSGRQTPDKIRAFHHRGGEVGRAHRHSYLALDPDARYGVKTKGKGGVEECLQPPPPKDALLHEDNRSERRHPLGRARAPSTAIPEPPAGFGVATVKDGSTREVMAGWREVEPRHRPGVGINRGYDWEAAGIDTSTYSFGKPTPPEKAGGMRTLAGRAAGLVIVPKVVHGFKLTKDAPLGRSRGLGFTNPTDAQNGAARSGVKAASTRGCAANGFQLEQPTVKELLSSWAVHKDLAGEADGSHPQAATAPEKAPVEAPFASQSRRNLGDEATAAQLLYPCHYVALGVDSKSFAGGRDLDDIRDLCLKCNFGLTETQIQQVFAATAVEGKCGIEQFKNTARAMRFM